jgi:hypothetical protein
MEELKAEVAKLWLLNSDLLARLEEVWSYCGELRRDYRQALYCIQQVDKQLARQWRRADRSCRREQTLEALVQRLRATRRRPDPDCDKSAKRIDDMRLEGVSWTQISIRENDDVVVLRRRWQRWKKRQREGGDN